MRREDLRAIEGLTEEQINEIMRLHGQDEAAHQTTVQGLQAQLATAQQGLAAFDGVDINDLRSQITNLTNQLSQQAAEFTFTGVLRTSNPASRTCSSRVLPPRRTAQAPNRSRAMSPRATRSSSRSPAARAAVHSPPCRSFSR